jgi:hypothetical protein
MPENITQVQPELGIPDDRLTDCAICGLNIPRSRLIERPRSGATLLICSECERRNYKTCPDCGHRVHAREICEIRTATDPILCCLACRSNYPTCPSCERYYLADDGERTPSGDTICPRCFSRNYRICPNCDESVEAARAIGYNGASYCPDCFNASYAYCEECDNIVNREELTYDEDDEDNICPACVENRPRRRPKRIVKSESFALTCGIKRAFGIELECTANEERVLQGLHFQPTSDGSIRCLDSQRAVEFRSGIFQGDKGIELIREFLAEVAECEYGVNASCGFHVHVDARDITKQELVNLVCFMKRFEPIIYKLCPPSRAGNQYCRPVSIPDSDISIMRSNALPLGAWRGLDRYRGFNIQSFFKHGSIEFRYHSGTLNPEKIISWVLLCVSIIERAKGHAWKNKQPLQGSAIKRNLRRLFQITKLPEPVRAFFTRRYRKFNGGM